MAKFLVNSAEKNQKSGKAVSPADIVFLKSVKVGFIRVLH